MSEKIEVDAAELKELLETNRSLLTKVEGLEQSMTKMQQDKGDRDIVGNVLMKQVKEHKVTVLFLDGKAVVGMANKGTERSPFYIYQIPDNTKKDGVVNMADLLLEGQTEPVAVDHVDFLNNAEKRDCKIIRTENKEVIIEQGMVTQKVIDGYSLVETGVVVPAEVKYIQKVYVVDIDGRQVTIPEKYVNMAK